MNGIATYGTLLTIDMANIAIQCGQKMLQEALYKVCDKLLQNHSSREIEKAAKVTTSKVREAIGLLDEVIVRLNKTREPIIAELHLRDKATLGVPVFNIEGRQKLGGEK
jgi:hypothetical protein